MINLSDWTTFQITIAAIAFTSALFALINLLFGNELLSKYRKKYHSNSDIKEIKTHQKNSHEVIISDNNYMIYNSTSYKIIDNIDGRYGHNCIIKPEHFGKLIFLQGIKDKYTLAALIEVKTNFCKYQKNETIPAVLVKPGNQPFQGEILTNFYFPLFFASNNLAVET